MPPAAASPALPGEVSEADELSLPIAEQKTLILPADAVSGGARPASPNGNGETEPVPPPSAEVSGS